MAEAELDVASADVCPGHEVDHIGELGGQVVVFSLP